MVVKDSLIRGFAKRISACRVCWCAETCRAANTDRHSSEAISFLVVGSLADILRDMQEPNSMGIEGEEPTKPARYTVWPNDGRL